MSCMAHLIEHGVSGLAKVAVYYIGVLSSLAVEGVVIGQEVLILRVMHSGAHQHPVVGLTNNALKHIPQRSSNIPISQCIEDKAGLGAHEHTALKMVEIVGPPYASELLPSSLSLMIQDYRISPRKISDRSIADSSRYHWMSAIRPPMPSTGATDRVARPELSPSQRLLAGSFKYD